MPSQIVVATLQAAALSTASNVCAQILQAWRQEQPFILDLGQLVRFVALAFLTSPPNYHWQLLLERSFPAYASDKCSKDEDQEVEMKILENGESSDQPNNSTQHGSEESPYSQRQSRFQHVTRGAAGSKFSLRNTLIKWFIDCITMGALLNTLAFLILMGLMKGKSLAIIVDNLQKETFPIIVDSYKIWPVASIISFSFVPVHRRIVFLSFVGLLWGIYLSLVAVRV